MFLGLAHFVVIEWLYNKGTQGGSKSTAMVGDECSVYQNLS